MAIVRQVHGPRRDVMAFANLIKDVVDRFLEKSEIDPNEFAAALANAGVVRQEIDGYTRLGELTRLMEVLSNFGWTLTVDTERLDTSQTMQEMFVSRPDSTDQTAHIREEILRRLLAVYPGAIRATDLHVQVAKACNCSAEEARMIFLKMAGCQVYYTAGGLAQLIPGSETKT